MYRLTVASSARKALKKLSRSGRFDQSEFDLVVRTLCAGKALAPKFKDHQLKGSLQYSRECHLAFNLLVKYEIDEKLHTLTIEDIGTHDELFG
jgi:mRNA interferase YafQ